MRADQINLPAFQIYARPARLTRSGMGRILAVGAPTGEGSSPRRYRIVPLPIVSAKDPPDGFPQLLGKLMPV